jgi:hypothetical protein
VDDRRKVLGQIESLNLALFFRVKNILYNETLLFGGRMSTQLSSETAKVFAIAGASILGLIVANQTRKRVASAWRNWRSNEKSKTEPAK